MITTQLSALIQLAKVDNQLDDSELRRIMNIGKANGMAEQDVLHVIDHPESNFTPEYMTDDQRFECLYMVIQLMKVDGQVFKSEIEFCVSLAKKLGYKKDVVKVMSGMIYSDPKITTDRAFMKKRAQRYLDKRRSLISAAI
ncbi:TerB family tellurite resistance protein [Roseivirga sp. BDSF3-8]|uniref:tellurite resistance TerB family protein n=1 Tax=Roseivirga sp. BDSF3-8 TaxID=3241598 RepID=UPI003531F557